jgi:hypothetical protein
MTATLQVFSSISFNINIQLIDQIQMHRKFLHGSLYEENLDQPLGRALHVPVYGISEI